MTVDMYERPILFSTEMVEAILEGRKTQTRRLIKPFPSQFTNSIEPVVWANEQIYATSGRVPSIKTYTGFNAPPNAIPLYLEVCEDGQSTYCKAPARVDDVYWVREKWQIVGWNPEYHEVQIKYSNGDLSSWMTVDDDDWFNKIWQQCTDECVALGVPKVDEESDESDFDLTDFELRWRPSIFMPKWASRLKLRVAEIKPERLQDISDDDAIAEGIQQFVPATKKLFKSYKKDDMTPVQALSSFRTLWNLINGKKEGCSWNDNPWVWVIKFEVIDGLSTYI